MYREFSTALRIIPTWCSLPPYDVSKVNGSQTVLEGLQQSLKARMAAEGIEVRILFGPDFMQ
jgi:hypothetical protein